MTLGLPLDAWLLIIASIVPGLLLTGIYVNKARRIDAARAKSGEQQS